MRKSLAILRPEIMPNANSILINQGNSKRDRSSSARLNEGVIPNLKRNDFYI